MLDDIALACQRALDRVARWARLAPLPTAAGRRFLIVQIDGLSREVFDRALVTGGVPSLARLLRSGALRRQDMSVGLPSSTPAFQAAAMYGVRPDIPGFHYYDKREGLELHFPKPGVADLVERRHAEGRRGILEGGACYGCVFTGGATDSLLTFARLMKPTRAGMLLVRLPLSLALLGWVAVKCATLTGVELARYVLRLLAQPLAARPSGLRWLGLKITFSIWIRELFTHSVSADLYRGVPAVYVNYLDYDVFAHAFGPSHRAALRALRRVDAAIGRLARIIRRLPECGYDLYVCSDHGQALTRSFSEVSGGHSIEEVVRALLGDSADRAEPPGGARPRRAGFARQLARYRRRDAHGLVQRFFNHLERDTGGLPEPPAAGDSVRIIAAGPNAFVYFTDSPEPLTLEDIERRHPGAAARLSEHPGVGIVLEGLRDLMAMRSAGDLVIYGIGAPGGDISFIDERGAHAGVSPAELHTFLLHPATVQLPRAPLSHPIQLYPHFAAYGEAAPRPAGSLSSR